MSRSCVKQGHKGNLRVPAADGDFEPDIFLLRQRQVEQILGRGKDLPDLGRGQAGAGVLDVQEADCQQTAISSVDLQESALQEVRLTSVQGLEENGCELLVGSTTRRKEQKGGSSVPCTEDKLWSYTYSEARSMAGMSRTGGESATGILKGELWFAQRETSRARP